MRVTSSHAPSRICERARPVPELQSLNNRPSPRPSISQAMPFQPNDTFSCQICEKLYETGNNAFTLNCAEEGCRGHMCWDPPPKKNRPHLPCHARSALFAVHGIALVLVSWCTHGFMPRTACAWHCRCGPFYVQDCLQKAVFSTVHEQKCPHCRRPATHYTYALLSS